jgi:ferrous iron transport protein A
MLISLNMTARVDLSETMIEDNLSTVRNDQGLTTLAELMPGEKAVVHCLDMTSTKNHKLIAMGFIPGTWLTVSKYAPLGDPLEVRLRNYTMSMRKSTARRITVRRLPE